MSEHEPRGNSIFVVRMPGTPSRKEVQEFIKSTEAILVGAYKIFVGVPSRGSPGRNVDGVEFIFCIKEERFEHPLEKSGTIYRGIDLTDWYLQRKSTDSTAKQTSSLPLLPPEIE